MRPKGSRRKRQRRQNSQNGLVRLTLRKILCWQRSTDTEAQLADAIGRLSTLVNTYRDARDERTGADSEQEIKLKDLEEALQRAREDLGAAQDEVNRLSANAQEREVVHSTTRAEPERRMPEGPAEAAGDLPQTPKPEPVKSAGGYSSLGASRAYKVKEADKAQVPDFPNLASLPQWRAVLLNNLVQASGRPDDLVVIKWVQEAVGDTKSFEELGDVGDMSLTQLDSKLCLAMTAMLTRAGDKSKDIRDKLRRHMLDNARKSRVTRGRQVAKLTLECLKTADQLEAVCCLTHLGDVSIVNEDLQSFLTKWNLVLDGLSGGRPNELLSRDTFYNKIKEPRPVAEEPRRSHLRQVGGVRGGRHHHEDAKAQHRGAGRPHVWHTEGESNGDPSRASQGGSSSQRSGQGRCRGSLSSCHRHHSLSRALYDRTAQMGRWLPVCARR